MTDLSCLRRAPDLLQRDLGEEILAARPDGSGIQRLEGSARRIWDLLATPRTAVEVIEASTAGVVDPPDTAAEEIRSFLRELVADGLVEEVPRDGA